MRQRHSLGYGVLKVAAQRHGPHQHVLLLRLQPGLYVTRHSLGLRVEGSCPAPRARRRPAPRGPPAHLLPPPPAAPLFSGCRLGLGLCGSRPAPRAPPARPLHPPPAGPWMHEDIPEQQRNVMNKQKGNVAALPGLPGTSGAACGIHNDHCPRVMGLKKCLCSALHHMQCQVHHTASDKYSLRPKPAASHPD